MGNICRGQQRKPGSCVTPSVVHCACPAEETSQFFSSHSGVEREQFLMVSAGGFCTVLYRNDGCVVACGRNQGGQCDIPELEEGLSYTPQLSAGWDHTVLLRSDGRAVTCGSNHCGQCDIPPLDKGLSYVQVSAGCTHTVLLRSDGWATACGNYDFGQGQCEIPAFG